MNENLTAFAKDNNVRVSLLKLNNLVRLIVNQKVDRAINQLKFSQKRISASVAVVGIQMFDQTDRVGFRQ